MDFVQIFTILHPRRSAFYVDHTYSFTHILREMDTVNHMLLFYSAMTFHDECSSASITSLETMLILSALKRPWLMLYVTASPALFSL